MQDGGTLGAPGTSRIGDPDPPEPVTVPTDPSVGARSAVASAALWCTGFLHAGLGVVMLLAPARHVIGWLLTVAVEIAIEAAGGTVAPGALDAVTLGALAIGSANLAFGMLAFGGGVALAAGERWGGIVGAVASAGVVPTWLVPPLLMLVAGALAQPRWIDLEVVLALALALAVPAILATFTALIAATAPARARRAQVSWAEECERDARQLAG
jgi:hypothetical protein